MRIGDSGIVSSPVRTSSRPSAVPHKLPERQGRSPHCRSEGEILAALAPSAQCIFRDWISTNSGWWVIIAPGRAHTQIVTSVLGNDRVVSERAVREAGEFSILPYSSKRYLSELLAETLLNSPKSRSSMNAVHILAVVLVDGREILLDADRLSKRAGCHEA